MARPLRIELPDAIYHVTSRSNDGKAIFLDDVDRRKFTALLGQAVQTFGWSLTAWTLMTNHFHLVFQTPEPNLARGMHWLNSCYVGWFNRRHKKRGHLFQGRYASILVQDEAHLRDVLRYVALNPVRAKMVARPENYRWSSYRETIGLVPAEPWLDTGTLLSLFDVEPEAALTIYREFVVAKIDSSERLWERLIHRRYLGSESWAKAMLELARPRSRSTGPPRPSDSPGRPAQVTSTASSLPERPRIHA